VQTIIPTAIATPLSCTASRGCDLDQFLIIHMTQHGLRIFETACGLFFE